MEIEKKEIAPEVSDNTSKEDNSTAAPAESPESEKEAVKLKEDIDPRIVGIVGEDKIKSAFGEKPEEEENLEDGKQKEKEATEEGQKKENQEEEEEGKETEVEKTPSQEPKPTRLDRRLVDRYIHNLHLMGEKNIPTEEEVMADLKNYSKEEKIQALHFHLQQEKKLRGEKPTGDDLEEEDMEAIQDAERESIRQEVIDEIRETEVKTNFVQFIDEHPELDETKKDYNPKMARAVETLWRGGMLIEEAFQTVSEQIQAVKEEQASLEKRNKSAALSGVMNGSGQVPNDKNLTWEDVDRLSKEDPQTYRRMLAEGKFKHLM